MIAYSSADSSWNRSCASFSAPPVDAPRPRTPTQTFVADASAPTESPAVPLNPSTAMQRACSLEAGASAHPATATETGRLAQPDSEGGAPMVRQYLLVCHARSISITQGLWCFSLESICGEPILDVECEEEGDLNRLSLLAAVRGLESIDGRGAVSLISNNRYLIRSLDRSLPRWRENDFVWEQFGRKMPVQNADLWRRIDRTLGIHSVTASLLQSTRVSTGPVDPRTPFASALIPAEAESAHPVLRFDRPHAATGEGPSDGLRRWLAGNCDAAPIVTRRGRYRAADIAGG